MAAANPPERKDRKMTLMELSKKESGIIVFENGDIIVANWMSAGDDQLPLLSPFGNDLINFPFADGTIEAAAGTAREVDDIRDELPDGGVVVYDYNNDIPALLKSAEPTGGTVYTLEDGKKIIAPYDWA